MSSALTLLVVLVLAAGALVLEGRTVLRALGGLAPGGHARVRRIGWSFLATEVWVIALLGLRHATLPGLGPEHLAATWLPLMAYGAGWMLRDWGLWQVALRDAPGWARIVGAGAAVQALAVVGLAAGVAHATITGTTPPQRWSDLTVGPGGVPGALIAVVALLCVVLVGGLQVLWARLPGRSPNPTSQERALDTNTLPPVVAVASLR